MSTTAASHRHAAPATRKHPVHGDDLDLAPGTPGGADASVDMRVYVAMSKALLSGKLRPGTPLRERTLAQALDCTRGAIRKVLARLGAEKKLVLEHNRGAFVPNPSIEDMRSVYRARRIVEAGLITTLFDQASPGQTAALRAHVEQEERAHEEGRREDAIRLSGEFHLLLARMAGSAELLEYLQRLVSNTELYMALFDTAVEHDSCAPHEHGQIIDALAGNSLPKALAAAMKHLDEVEQRVLAGAAAERKVDLASLLARA
ncbi:MAG: GntR family transcriptional regulator [Proteobacteria bacterium]|nr:GntR family transcriptional regulator [Pseudomonadota bacterium]